MSLPWLNVNNLSTHFTRNPPHNSRSRSLRRSVLHIGIMDSGSELKIDEVDTCNPFEPRRLDFDPQSFVNVGSWLSAQEKRSTISTATQTTSPPEPPVRNPRRLYVMCGLALLFLMLFTSNAFFWFRSREWKAERLVMQGRIEHLESLVKRTPRHAPELSSTREACRGELLDTCWFKVGLGSCAKDALGDPIAKAEGAWRTAWDHAAGLIGGTGEAIAREFDELGKELRLLGDAAGQFLEKACGMWSDPRA